MGCSLFWGIVWLVFGFVFLGGGCVCVCVCGVLVGGGSGAVFHVSLWNRVWIVLWNLNLRRQKNHISYGSQSDPHLLAESSTNSSDTSGSPQRLSQENSQTDLVKYWEQSPPFLRPLPLNMLHPPRTTVFYQALSTSVPWSFKAKKPAPGSVGERREMSLQRQCLSPLFLVTLSVGSRALMGGPQYLTAFLEPKNNPQTRDGANPEKSTLHSGQLSRLDYQGFEGA